ncbi:MAG: thioredoxin family protein [Planctomycetota bacterium]
MLASTLLAATLASPVATIQEPARWYADLEKARTVAAAEGKHVLVDFTGTGWCAWCKRLDDEVLSKPRFVERAAESFVLVRLDFDVRGRARRDLPRAEQNDGFREAAGVTAFPTVLLLTAEGVPYARQGYREGGAMPYADWVRSEHDRAVALQRAVPDVVAGVARAKSAEEARGAADAATRVLRDAGAHALARPLVPIVRTVLGEDELSTERERAAVAALVFAEAVDDDVLERAFLLDPRNREGLPEAALLAAIRRAGDAERARVLVDRAEGLLRTTEVFDRRRAARLYGDCAVWCKNSLGAPDRARALARFALSLKPEDRELRDVLESLSGG